MVPVGGSVVASSNPEFIKKVSQIYPGMYSFDSLWLASHSSLGIRVYFDLLYMLDF